MSVWSCYQFGVKDLINPIKYLTRKTFFFQLRLDGRCHWWRISNPAGRRGSAQDPGLGRERSGPNFSDVEVDFSAFGGNEDRIGRSPISSCRSGSRSQRTSQVFLGRRRSQEFGKFYKFVILLQFRYWLCEIEIPISSNNFRKLLFQTVILIETKCLFQ